MFKGNNGSNDPCNESKLQTRVQAIVFENDFLCRNRVKYKLYIFEDFLLINQWFLLHFFRRAHVLDMKGIFPELDQQLFTKMTKNVPSFFEGPSEIWDNPRENDHIEWPEIYLLRLSQELKPIIDRLYLWKFEVFENKYMCQKLNVWFSTLRQPVFPLFGSRS